MIEIPYDGQRVSYDIGESKPLPGTIHFSNYPPRGGEYILFISDIERHYLHNASGEGPKDRCYWVHVNDPAMKALFEYEEGLWE